MKTLTVILIMLFVPCTPGNPDDILEGYLKAPAKYYGAVSSSAVCIGFKKEASV